MIHVLGLRAANPPRIVSAHYGSRRSFPTCHGSGRPPARVEVPGFEPPVQNLRAVGPTQARVGL